MSYTIEIIEGNLLPLPDTLCAELGFAVGDILVCERDKDCSAIRMQKHADRTLTDKQIASAGSLSRVISLTPDE